MRDELVQGLERLLETSSFINGPDVERFENAFASYCGSSHCVGMASGLDALRLSLLAAGLERGDRVIVPANTFVATFEAVTQAGGVPVVVDVTERDYCMSSGGLRSRWLGNPSCSPSAPLRPYVRVPLLREISRSNDLLLIEDAGASARGNA